MATIPCPVCGLPRVAEEVGQKPCPVCESGAALPTVAVVPTADRPPDPVHGLPADAHQFVTQPHAQHHGHSVVLVGLAGFIFGALVAGLGVAAWWAASEPAPSPTDSRPTPRAAELPPPPTSDSPSRQTEVAPPPREVAIAIAPLPRLVGTVALVPAPGRPVYFVDIDDPEGSYSFPSSQLSTGGRFVLRGRVKVLKLGTIDKGAFIDASGLEAEQVPGWYGHIDGGSTLRLRLPKGSFTLNGWIGGGSVVEIDAPGGEVRIARPGSKEPGDQPAIFGGARVMITAKGVDIKGAAAGDATRVSVALSRLGWLKLTAARGAAVIEYRNVEPGSPPDVFVGELAPTATLRRLEPPRANQ